MDVHTVKAARVISVPIISVSIKSVRVITISVEIIQFRLVKFIKLIKLGDTFLSAVMTLVSGGENDRTIVDDFFKGHNMTTLVTLGYILFHKGQLLLFKVSVFLMKQNISSG